MSDCQVDTRPVRLLADDEMIPILAAFARPPLVLLRLTYRDGRVRYEHLPRLVAEMTLAALPEIKPDVARALILPDGERCN